MTKLVETLAQLTPARGLQRLPPATIEEWLLATLGDRFRLLFGGCHRLRSSYGVDWQVGSFASILPRHAPLRIVERVFARQMDAFLEGLEVERPGGVLVLRGLAPTAEEPVPLGIEVTKRDLGEAQRCRIAIAAHPMTLEAARAAHRQLVSATLL